MENKARSFSVALSVNGGGGREGSWIRVVREKRKTRTRWKAADSRIAPPKPRKSILNQGGWLLPFAAGVEPFFVSVHPGGKFAYVANSGSANISAYAIDPTTGVLTAVAGSPFAAGTAPFSVAVDPAGKCAYVANSGTGDVSVYTIDPTTGGLTAIAGSPFAAGDKPYSIAIDPSGKFAYVANRFAGHASAFSIDAGTGALTEIGDSPYASGTDPYYSTFRMDKNSVDVGRPIDGHLQTLAEVPLMPHRPFIARVPSLNSIGRPQPFAIRNVVLVLVGGRTGVGHETHLPWRRT